MPPAIKGGSPQKIAYWLKGRSKFTCIATCIAATDSRISDVIKTGLGSGILRECGNEL